MLMYDCININDRIFVEEVCIIKPQNFVMLYLHISDGFYSNP